MTALERAYSAQNPDKSIIFHTDLGSQYISNDMKDLCKKLNEIVTKIRLGMGSDEEFDRWISQIRQSVPHPNVLNVVTRNKEGLSNEEIVDKLLSYKLIILP